MSSCAVLCNGPSRFAFKSDLGYNYVIGCNIPWTDVNVTIIIDQDVVKYLSDNVSLIKNDIVFGRDAWRYTDKIKKRRYFDRYMNDIIDVPREPYYSSGHAAVQYAIDNGYTEIDIYGCDSYFDEGLESYTHKFLDTTSPDSHIRMLSAWKVRWDYMIHKYPAIWFNFIKE